MQYKRKRKKTIALWLVIVFMFTIMSTAFFSSAATVSELQDRLEEIEDKKSDAKSDLNQIQSDKASEQATYNEYAAALKEVEESILQTEQKIAELEADILIKQDAIEVYNEKIDSINADIAVQQEKINIKEQEFDETFTLLKQRMRAMYMAGEASTIEILLTSKDFSDFITKCEFVKGIAKHDADLMVKIEEMAQQLRDAKAKLEEAKNEVVELRDIVLEQISLLEEDKANCNSQKLIQEALKKQRQTLLDESKGRLDDLSDAEKELKKQLSDLDTDQKMIENLLNPPSTGGSASGTSSGSGSKINMIWPVQGCKTYISSPYGPRWGTIHRGMDISGANVYGKSVVAVASGTVVLALNTNVGYGKYVIVDHGNGVATLYAHCSSLLVSVGDKVSQGQTIAKVGSTGNSTGPHVHFEVRINGERVNPANYL